MEIIIVLPYCIVPLLDYMTVSGLKNAMIPLTKKYSIKRIIISRKTPLIKILGDVDHIKKIRTEFIMDTDRNLRSITRYREQLEFVIDASLK